MNLESIKLKATAAAEVAFSKSSPSYAWAHAYGPIAPSDVLELIERMEAAEARCAELQSHQDDYDRAHAGTEAAERDAARYRWIRAQSHLSLVVVDRSPEHIDKMVDEMMQEPT